MEYVLVKTLSGQALSRLPNDEKLRDFAQEWFPLPEESLAKLGEDDEVEAEEATAVPA